MAIQLYLYINYRRQITFYQSPSKSIIENCDYSNHNLFDSQNNIQMVHKQFPHSSSRSLALTSILFLIIFSIESQLLCNPNFETYVLNQKFNGEYYVHLASNTSCWYAKSLSKWQVKEKTSPEATKVAELTATNSYILCQNVSLIEGRNYTLEYDGLSQTNMINMKFTVQLNGNAISQLFLANANQFGHGKVEFQADYIENMLCFYENHGLSTFSFNSLVMGGCLDNVTLIQEATTESTVTETNTTNNTGIIQQNNTSIHSTSNNSIGNTTDQSNMTIENYNSTDNGTETVPGMNNTNVSSTSTPQNNSTSSPQDNSASPQNNSTNMTNWINIEENNTNIADLPDLTNSSIEVPEGINLPIDPSNLNPQSLQELSKIQSQQYVLKVFCTTKVDQIQGIVIIESDHPYEKNLKEYLEVNMEIYFEDQLQLDFHFQDDQEGNLTVIIRTLRSYNLEDIQIVIPDDRTMFENMITVEFYINNRRIYLQILTADEAKNLQQISEISLFLTEAVSQIKLYIGSTICSYFIISLINFWNLSLMYYFLQISTVPNFVKQLYDNMLKFIFIKGSILEWFYDIHNVQITYESLMLEQEVQEHIQEWKNGYSWLAGYGFSSKLIKNNYQNSFYFVGVMIKIGIAKLILRLLSSKIKSILNLSFSINSVVTGQLILISPFIIISSQYAIVESSLSYLEKFSKVGHIMLLFIIFLVPLVLVMMNIKGQTKKQKKRKLLRKKQRQQLIKSQEYKQEMKSNYQLKCQWFSYCLNYSIPLLVTLENPQAFIIINSIIITCKFVYFISKFKRVHLAYRIYGLSINLIWGLHHIMFTTLFILEKMRTNQMIQEQRMLEIAKNCGMVVCLTVFLGGGFEIIKFLSDIVMDLGKIMKNIIKACTDKEKSDQNKQEEAKQETGEEKRQNAETKQENHEMRQQQSQGRQNGDEQSNIRDPKFLATIHNATIDQAPVEENTKTQSKAKRIKLVKSQKKARNQLNVIYNENQPNLPPNKESRDQNNPVFTLIYNQSSKASKGSKNRIKDKYAH